MEKEIYGVIYGKNIKNYNKDFLGKGELQKNGDYIFTLTNNTSEILRKVIYDEIQTKIISDIKLSVSHITKLDKKKSEEELLKITKELYDKIPGIFEFGVKSLEDKKTFVNIFTELFEKENLIEELFNRKTNRYPNYYFIFPSFLNFKSSNKDFNINKISFIHKLQQNNFYFSRDDLSILQNEYMINLESFDLKNFISLENTDGLNLSMYLYNTVLSNLYDIYQYIYHLEYYSFITDSVKDEYHTDIRDGIIGYFLIFQDIEPSEIAFPKIMRFSQLASSLILEGNKLSNDPNILYYRLGIVTISPRKSKIITNDTSDFYIIDATYIFTKIENKLFYSFGKPLWIQTINYEVF